MVDKFKLNLLNMASPLMVVAVNAILGIIIVRFFVVHLGLEKYGFLNYTTTVITLVIGFIFSINESLFRQLAIFLKNPESVIVIGSSWIPSRITLAFLFCIVFIFPFIYFSNQSLSVNIDIISSCLILWVSFIISQIYGFQSYALRLMGLQFKNSFIQLSSGLLRFALIYFFVSIYSSLVIPALATLVSVFFIVICNSKSLASRRINLKLGSGKGLVDISRTEIIAGFFVFISRNSDLIFTAIESTLVAIFFPSQLGAYAVAMTMINAVRLLTSTSVAALEYKFLKSINLKFKLVTLCIVFISFLLMSAILFFNSQFIVDAWLGRNQDQVTSFFNSYLLVQAFAVPSVVLFLFSFSERSDVLFFTSNLVRIGAFLVYFFCSYLIFGPVGIGLQSIPMSSFFAVSAQLMVLLFFGKFARSIDKNNLISIPSIILFYFILIFLVFRVF